MIRLFRRSIGSPSAMSFLGHCHCHHHCHGGGCLGGCLTPFIVIGVLAFLFRLLF